MRKNYTFKLTQMSYVTRIRLGFLFFSIFLFQSISAYAKTSDDLITNITAVTGNTYNLGLLNVGTRVYSDRVQFATNVPAFLNNAPFIKAADNDKDNTSTSMLSFELTKKATVYIAYDENAEVLPAWLSDWQQLPGQVGVSAGLRTRSLLLYSKTYSAGTVTLGGNLASPAAGARNNFLVVALRQSAGFVLTLTKTGEGTVTSDPYQPDYPDGTSVTLTATPAAGQQFNGWSGAASGTTNPLTIQMVADKSITANFGPVTYTLTTIASGNGTVTSDPAGPAYSPGTNVALTAIPANGYQFTGWAGSASGTSNPLTLAMDANKSVTANFTPVPYTITVDISGNGTVTKNPDQPTYTIGTQVTLTAIPAAGQQFVSWSDGSGTSTTNPLTITISGNRSGTATFAPVQQHSLTVVTSGNGTVTKNPDQSNYNNGSTVTLTATPSAGEQFTGWGGAASGTVNPLTITMDADKTVTAGFAAIAYTLTTTVNGNGTLTRNPDQATYTSGASVTITATPGSGQLFTGWSGDAGGTANPLTVTLNANKNITASFASVSSALISNITANTGHPYALGTLVTGTTVYTDRAYQVTSVPALLNNASFIKTPNDDKGNKTAAPLSFNLAKAAIVYVGYDPRAKTLPAWMNGWQKLAIEVGINDPGITHLVLYSKSFSAGNVTLGGNLASPAAGAANMYIVMAILPPPQYTLTVTTSGNGTVTKNPNQPDYTSGTNVILTAVPAAGQQFTGWSGAATGTTNPLTITMDADKAVTATFAPLPQYSLTIVVSGNGTVTKNPDQPDYTSGTSVILTATPAAGQQFTGWSGAATGTTNPLTVIIDAEKSVTATFAPLPEYTVTVTANGNGAVTKNPDQLTYTSGTSVTLTATAGSGQLFTGWSGDAGGTANPLTVTVNSNKNITANFAPVASALISNVTTTTGHPYTLGTLVAGTTVYSDRAYQVTSVPFLLNNAPFIKTPNDDKGNKTASPLSFNLAQAAIVYVGYDPRAKTLPAWMNSWQKLAIEVGINDPGITRLVLYSKNFPAGKVTLGGNLASPASGALNMYIVAAILPPPQYTLTVTASGNGTVTKNPNQADYVSGTSVVLTATPAAGQQFTGWSGDATGTTNPLTIIMEANKSVTATFAPIPQYNLTVTVSGNGTVTKNPDQATYLSGTSVVLTATPAAGQQFTGWSGAFTGTTNPLTLVMDADKLVTATFAPLQYTLTVSTSGNGTVTKNPDQSTYNSGTNVILTAIPAAGQQFTGWSGAATGTTNPLTITIDANKSVTATFAPLQYTLTVSTSGNGTVTKNPDQPTYNSGTNVTLTAMPAAGQQFTGWSGSATGAVNPLTLTMDAAKTVTATFAPIQYALTVTLSGSGTVTKNPDQPAYNSGTSVVLTATPAAGQQFIGWSGSATSTVNPLTITMDAAKTITATFAPIQYALTLTLSGSGTVTKNPNQATYAVGTSVVLTATPAAGQQFAGWSGSAISTANPLTITMDAAKNITATFTPIQYALTVDVSGNGTVTKNPNQATYASGTNVVLTATPAAGQQFTGWSGSAAGTANPLTVTMDAAKTITATFAPLQYALTVTVSGSGTVTKNPDQATYASGTSVVLTATPAAGQQFTGWSGSVTGTVNPLTITMDAAKNITATFTPIQYALTVTITGNGTVTKNPDQATYASGTNVVLTATPAAGQQFAGWSGSATGTVNPLTVTIDAAKSVTATFTSIQYALTISVSGSGTVTKNPDQATYASGTSMVLTATPAAGQQFTGWSGDATGSTNPLTVVMNSAKTISANFAVTSAALITNVTATTASTYTLGQLVVGTTIYSDRAYVATSVPPFLNNAPCIKTPNADKNNKTTNILSFTLTQGATVYVGYDPRGTVLPAWLSSWQKLATQVGFNDPGISGLTLYSKIYPAGTVTIGGNLATPAAGALDNYFVAAVLSPLYSLTTTASGPGTITKSPDKTIYQGGTSVLLTATPAAGQQFMGWSGEASGTNNPLTVLMDGNKSVTATFAKGAKSVFFTQATQTAEVEQGGSQDLLEYISTSDNIPSNTKLTALDEGGNVPTWLSVNGAILNGINYTSNSEITFSFDATNLSIGTYSAVITASSAGYNSAVLDILLTVKQGSAGALTNIKVDFQDSITVTSTGYLRDFGQAFGPRTSPRQDSGYFFGWLKKSDNTPLNLTKNGRNRNTPADVLLATFIHMQANDIPTFTGTKVEGIWEAQVANGNYDVTVSVGDGSQVDSKHSINIEGVSAISAFVPTTTTRFKSATITVSVADGFLTLDATGGVNTKINYVIIKPSTSKRPSVVDVNPENSSQNVSENTSISTSILNLPNGGIDNATIDTLTVFLTEEGTGTLIRAHVNGTGGGDAITLVPIGSLKLNTSYLFNITSGVKDLSGSPFIPYTSSFTTGSGSTTETITAKFDKIELPNTSGNHSSLTIGPDGKLYALSIDGLIKRFTINNNGTLGTPDSLYSLQDAYGTRKPTLAISLVFDPSSTANNLIAWITHSSSYVFLNGPPWDGKLSKLTGANLQNVQDILVNLPRSAKDHVTNSIAFGPDGKLYFTQASTSAMGSADKTWNNRNETLLSAAVLRLDVSKLGALPLDVKTPDGGGTYNPYAANAPLTIYASGIRNAYDLIWHSNGNLYTPTNGSAAGGNTPSSVNGTLRPNGTVYNGPVITGLTNVQQTQKDFLFRVVKGGFYGHPNGLRGEYVMNGGNPTAAIDPAQVNAYPVGTMPDINYRGYAFDFQNNASPNGAIEYKSNTFNGALKGKILVVRYSQHDDIITLTPGGPDNDIISAIDGISIPGFSGFEDPLNLTEDLSNGNLYVSEYGGGKIDLLRVNTSASAADTTNVIADAFVRSDSYGGTNYGSDTTLAVKGNRTAGGLTRLSYLKFPLKSISNVTSAKLRLYGHNEEDTAKVNVAVFSVANDAWKENTIIYNSSPVGSALPISMVGVNSVAKYYDFDVTNFVISESTGDKVVSFLLKDTANKNKKIVFNSKENLRFKPQLVIVANGDTIILSDGIAPAAGKSVVAQQAVARTTKNSNGVRQVSSPDSSSMFSLEEMPYMAEHNFEKPKLYPNPFHNKFNIAFPSKYEGNFTMEIIDLLGHTYKIGSPRLRVGGSNMEVNISKLMLKPGTYFLKIYSGAGKTDAIKLVIR